jgi:ABC-type transport system substrate-binding protein
MKKLRVSWAILLLVLVLSLAACGGGEQPAAPPQQVGGDTQPTPATDLPTDPATPATTDQATPATQEQATPVAEQPTPDTAPTEARGVLRIAQGTDPVTLDAHRVTDSPTASVVQHIVEPLFNISHEDGSLEPGLALSGEMGDDGLSWTIRLREGVMFHDGTPFNAEAVRANLERILDPDNAITFRFLVARITEVEVEDEYTVILRTEEPFAPMLAHLTHSSIGMMSPQALESMSDEELADNPVGTGPFTVASWTRGERIVLERNPDYWGESATIERLEFITAREDGARMVLIETGEADIAVRVPSEDIQRLDALNNVRVDVTTGLRTIYIGFNTQAEPFNDPRVRQAMNYAINKEEIVEFILGGQARVSDAPIAPNVFGYTAAGPYEYDPERARELLAEAGYGDGLTFTFVHPTGRYMQDARIADAVRSQLAEIGVTAELQTMEWAQYLEHTNRPLEETDVQMFMLGWGTVTADADYGLWALFHTSEHVPAGSNRAFYSNPEVDQLLEQGRTAEAGEREGIYADAIRILWEDAPWLYLYSESQVTAVREGVEGVIIHPAERIIATYARVP